MSTVTGKRIFSIANPWMARYAYVHALTNGDISGADKKIVKYAMDSIATYADLVRALERKGIAFDPSWMTAKLAEETYDRLKKHGVLGMFEKPSERMNKAKFNEWMRAPMSLIDKPKSILKPQPAAPAAKPAAPPVAVKKPASPSPAQKRATAQYSEMEGSSSRVGALIHGVGTDGNVFTDDVFSFGNMGQVDTLAKQSVMGGEVHNIAFESDLLLGAAGDAAIYSTQLGSESMDGPKTIGPNGPFGGP